MNISNENIHVHYMDFPTTVGGRTVPNEDGSFDVFINSRYGYNGQRKALEHELRHIQSGDFDSDKTDDVQTKEMIAHGLKMDITQDPKPIMSQAEIQRRINNLRKRHKKLMRECAKRRKYNELLRQIGIRPDSERL